MSNNLWERAGEEPSYILVRTVMLGAYGVGKTSLSRRLRDASFDLNESTTIGIDFFSKRYETVGVNLNVWDTAGQERFHAVSTAYYRMADVFLLVFSVCDAASFAKLPFYLQEIESHQRQPSIPVIIVGNMANEDIDMGHGPATVVARAEAQRFADAHNLPYLETSARTDAASVKRLFEEVVRIGKPVAAPRKSAMAMSDDGLRTPPSDGHGRGCCNQ